MSFKKCIFCLVVVVLYVLPVRGGWRIRADRKPLFARSSYKEVIKAVKEVMYEEQKNFMSEQEYFSFIDPYVKQAETEFESFSFCKKYPNRQESSDCLEAVLNLNIACFMYHVDPNEKNTENLDRSQEKLITCYTRMAKYDKSIKINAQDESNKIKSFLLEINEEYYGSITSTSTILRQGLRMVCNLFKIDGAVQ